MIRVGYVLELANHPHLTTAHPWASLLAMAHHFAGRRTPNVRTSVTGSAVGNGGYVT